MYAFLIAAQTFIADRFDNKDRGATAVEYGIMVAGIAIVIIVAVFAFGGQLRDLFLGLDLTP
ncbi:Flp family type IVb pilin [Agrococcus sp. SCSIO52902]|uniref:Flp family type IVb pilin n=1 Tax=Agrococcus sp. SCSIO52902 TaxID=2933290 RepID=UPI001FF5A89C|nr:Flp family type IVb pilin [Agrococcus sp. SCSIO52902]UOW00017.1 Flp family type IVb pilin [Agrococcus sp. SCSIO52902]